MNQFHIGLVSEYFSTRNGYHVALDTGKSALLPPDHPIPEQFLDAKFSLDLFARNHGIALHTDPWGKTSWYPAHICAIILGASYRKDGSIVGMEEWTPQDTTPPTTSQESQQRNIFDEGTITVGLIGGTVAPYYIFNDMPGYAEAGVIVKEVVDNIRISDGEQVFTARNADRNILKDLQGKKGVSINLARMDFAYTLSGYEIVYVQKTICPDQEFALNE